MTQVLDRLEASRVLRWLPVALGFYLVQQALWPAPFGVLLNGVVIGGLTALIAAGIVLVYRANRIVNFAQADMGALPAMVVVLLLLRTGVPYPLALVFGLALGMLVGALVQRVLVRRFFKAPRLILTVVTIGLAQLLGAAGAVVQAALTNSSGQSLFRRDRLSPLTVEFTVGPVTFHGNDVLALVAVPALLIGLTLLLRRTSLGMAIRATAESADRASLLGIPVMRVQVAVWATAAVLSTAGMFLRIGILGMASGSVSTPGVLLRALTAAVIGRMERLELVIAAAVGIGVLEQAILWHTGDGGLIDPILFLIVIAALLLQKRESKRSAEGDVATWRAAGAIRRMPRELWALREVRLVTYAGGAAAGLLALALPFWLSPGRTNSAGLVFVYAIVGISLVVLTGWSGQVSLGQIAFLGLGAAVGGAITLNWHWDLILSVLAAGVVGSVVAVLVGLPALRIQGLMLAVTTLAFALFVSSWFLDVDNVSWIPTTLDTVPRSPVLGRARIASEHGYYYVCLAGLVLALVGAWGVRQSRTGRALLAVRDNDRAAQAFGVNAVRVKLTAFAMSGFLATAAGALYIHHQQTMGSAVFEPSQSLRSFTMVVIGGIGSLGGAVVGSLYLNGLEWIRGFISVDDQELRTLVSFGGSGIGLIVVLAVLPEGLGGALFRLRDRWLATVARRHDIEAPTLSVREAAGSGASPVARPAVAPPADSLLSIRDAEVGYDGVQVLFGVDLDVPAGRVVALLGTNGAGKSTLLRAISGLNPPSAGTILFEGAPLPREPHEVVARGVVQMPGGKGVFPSLSVAENLQLATWLHRSDRQGCLDGIEEVLAIFPRLRERMEQPAGNLSGGEQQMLALAQTFLTRPRLVMIDELSLGLAPAVVRELVGVVERMRQQGITVVVVEQSVNVALTMADDAYFMEKGEVRFHGPTAELLDRPDILRSVFIEGANTRMNGDRVTPAVVATPTEIRPQGPVLLQLEGLGVSYGGVRAVDGVDLEVRQGEILGIIGPNGAGKTTLFDLVSGFVVPSAGRVLLDGVNVSDWGPDARARAGLGRSFQDARLFPTLTVRETVAVALERSIAVRDPLAAALHLRAVRDSERAISLRADDLVELLGLVPHRDKLVAELSTGTRRMVDLACVLAHEPRVLLLDEPSSGIAQRETEALGPMIRHVQAQLGCAIVVIEHDMPLITSISDDLVAMELGRVVVRDLPQAVLRHPRVVEAYLGGNDDVFVQRSGGTQRRRGQLTAAGTRA